MIPRTHDNKFPEKLARSIEKRLKQHSHEPLAITAEQAEETRKIIETLETEGYAKRQTSGEQHRQHQNITIADIANLKSRRHGSQVVCNYSDIELTQEFLNKRISTLEGMAERGQEAIANWQQLHFEKRRHDKAADSEGAAAAPRRLRLKHISENGKMLTKIVLERDAADADQKSENRSPSR